MIYGYVKQNGSTFEFLPDEGIEFENVIYGKQYLDSSATEFLSQIGVYKTELLPVPENALDADGSYYFNLRTDGIVEYRPNYTIGYRVPESITMLQARKILRVYGLFEAVNNAIINSDNVELKDEWEYALEVRRDWANLAYIATLINIDNELIDKMFIEGSAL